MSRIGRKPIEVPKGVTVMVKENTVTVKGPKGELIEKVHSDIGVEVKDQQVLITRMKANIVRYTGCGALSFKT